MRKILLILFIIGGCASAELEKSAKSQAARSRIDSGQSGTSSILKDL